MPEESGPMTSQPASAAPPASSPELPVPQGMGSKPQGMNGSPSPGKLPQARRLGNNVRALLAVMVVVLLGGGGFLIAYVVRGAAAGRADILTHTVRKENLQMAITERGQLESA